MSLPRPPFTPAGRRASDDGHIESPGPYLGRRRMTTATRQIMDLHLDRCAGIDVLIRNPQVRGGSPVVGDGVVWTGRATLNEIDGRSDLVDINASLLSAALSEAAALDVGVDAPFASVAVHHRFVADGEFLDIVKSAVRWVGLEANQLLLSVAAGEELETIWPAMQRLRSHGVRVALEQDEPPKSDDEKLLHRFPIDMVRIRAALALDDQADGARGPSLMLRSLVANERRVWVEDVASADDLALLRMADCKFVSGPALGEVTDSTQAG